MQPSINFSRIISRSSCLNTLLVLSFLATPFSPAVESQGAGGYEGKTIPVISGRLRSFSELAEQVQRSAEPQGSRFLPPFIEASDSVFDPPIHLQKPVATLSRIVRKAAPQVLTTPPPRIGFIALEDNDRAIPPDTQGAVGPNHLMVTLNSQVRIQSRLGVNISTVSLRQFWTNLVDNVENAFDPRVHYDIQAGRWIFVTIANGQSADSAVLAAVSETSDPTGNWFGFKVAGDPNGLFWADFPYIGLNSKWITVSTTLFSVAANKFGFARVFLLSKDSVYANGAVPFTAKMFDDEGGSNLSPSIDYDAKNPKMYLVTSLNGNSSGKGFLRLSTIEGALGSEIYNPGIEFPAVSSTWAAFSSPQDIAPQLGSESRINNGDHRIQSSVTLRNGSLWFCHNVFLPANDPLRTSVQWWELDLNGGIRQFGQIDDPTNNRFYAFPSLAVNKNNDVLIGYTRFAADQFASANYSFRAATDPPNTVRPDTVLKAGGSAYLKNFGGTRNRWGDYSSTVVDPLNEIDMWTLQQYSATEANTWGTWWGRFNLEPGGAPPSVSSLKPLAGGVGATVTITGTKFTDTTSVTFNGVNAARFTIESSSRLTAVVPLGASTGPVTVSTLDGTAASSDRFSVLPTPVISGFFPSRGAANSSVVISGLNFAGVSNVRFNDIDSAEFTVNSPSQISAIVPPAATTGKITVITANGTATGSSDFAVTLEPSISSFSPVKIGAGGTLVISGANFTGATSVLVGGQNAAQFSVDSVTQISAAIPPTATGGPIVVVTPTGTATSSDAFIVVSEPVISGFTPTDGFAGTSVTITGANLGDVTDVIFGQSSDPNFTIDSSRQITARVPLGTTTGLIRAISAGGSATSVEPFVVVLPPANDAFANSQQIEGSSGAVRGNNLGATKEIGEPDHAGSAGGRSVWYRWTAPSGGTWNLHTTGSEIDTTLAVYTGTQVGALTPVASNDDADTRTVASSLIFSALAGTEYKIAVAGFRDTSGTLDLSWINVASRPTIDGFSPTRGPEGATVSLLGANFSGTAQIRFNDVPATEFTIESLNRITVKVPINATTGPISITTNTGTTTSSDLFTVTPAVENDSFANARFISGSSGELNGTNSGATFEPAEPLHAGSTPLKSLWYRWTAPGNGIWAFDTRGSRFDTVLAVYTGSSVSALTQVNSNDDDQGATSSRVTFVAFAGSTYHLAIDGFGGAFGDLALNWRFSGDLPKILSFAPVRGNIAAVVTITGENFTADTSVDFNGIGTSSVAVVSDTQLTVTVPSGATTGPIRAATPQGAALSSVYFVVSNSDAPANDLFSGAQSVTGSNWIVSGRTLSASKEPQEPNHAGAPGGKSIWYKWVAPENASVTLATSGSNFDTTLAVYTGNSLDGLKVIAVNDDADGGATSKVQFKSVAGTEYEIAVDGYDGENGSVILKLVPTAESDVVFFSGFEATEGYVIDQTIVGQQGWDRSGAGDNLIVQHPIFGGGQQARIGFSTSGNTVRNSVWHPLDNTLPSVRFSVSLMIIDSTNEEHDFFDWSVFNLDGEHLFSIDFDTFGRFVSYELDDGEGLLLSDVGFEAGRVYQLGVSMDFRNNSWSALLDQNLIAENQPISSTGAPLNLGFIDAVWFTDETPGNNAMIFDNYRITAEPNSPPIILANPQNKTVSQGAQAAFGVVARGTDPLGYQWKFNGRDLTGSTNAVLTLNSVLPVHAGTYTVEARNTLGAATSQPATLTVTATPPPAAVLELSAGPLQPDGGFPLTLKSAPGIPFSIEVSTNLRDWTEVTSGVNTSGVFTFIGSAAPNFSERFFRARQTQ